VPRHFRSFQLPFQPLQCGSDFISPNHRLAFIAVGDAHQNGDVLESLFDKRQVTMQLNCLLGGKGLRINSWRRHGINYTAYIARSAIVGVNDRSGEQLCVQIPLLIDREPIKAQN